MIKRGVQRQDHSVYSIERGTKMGALVGRIVIHANVRVPTHILDVR